MGSRGGLRNPDGGINSYSQVLQWLLGEGLIFDNTLVVSEVSQLWIAICANALHCYAGPGCNEQEMR